MSVPDFQSVYAAWQQCRKRKRATPQAQWYETSLLDNLVQTVQALNDGSWQPAPPVCFAVSQPKFREIHAAAFKDRVVHHWLVPQLEALYEPVFIHDVYSNRKGKGTHAAVDRLQRFMHSVRDQDKQSKDYFAASTPRNDNSTTVITSKVKQSHDRIAKQGYFLQLDIKNFFNSIDKSVLFFLVQKRLHKSVKSGLIATDTAKFLCNLVHVTLKQDVGSTATIVGNDHLHCKIPAHKRFRHAGKDKGLPIGNLTSQFFANVYLNELDQFIKHQLKCKHYIRYVDDFILLHHDASRLRDWQQGIAHFLEKNLRLQLRQGIILKPCLSGVDFLGYIIKPNYRLVRRRVVGNLKRKLEDYSHTLLQTGAGKKKRLRLSASDREQLQSVLASYVGHFSHAHSHSLLSAIFRRYPWLNLLYRCKGLHLLPRWEPRSVSGYRSQINWFRLQYPNAILSVQRGTETDIFKPGVINHQDNSLLTGRFYVELVDIKEQGYLKGGLKRRVLEQLTWHHSMEQYQTC